MHRSVLVVALMLAGPLLAASQKPRLSSADMLALAQVEPERAFTLWSEHHGRTYREGSPEFTHRLNVFVDNVKAIVEHQARDAGVTLALNEYADETWEEFSSKRMGLRITDEQLQRKAELGDAIRPSWRYAGATTPTALDWREKGAVSEVKNQGGCGSCWAFSTTGAIEGVNAIVTGGLVSLSEQQLVDCDTETDMGCGGGLMDEAFKYVVANGGLDTEEDYSYWSGYGFGFWCNKRKQTDRPAVSIDGYEDVPTDEPSLLKAVAHQPVAVAICASAAMQFYSHGVISTCCDGLNHGVLAVGYDVAGDGAPYWVVKNSWGGGWGEKGYFRLKMGQGKMGLCGIASAASYPVKSTPNKPVPLMCDMFGWTECPVANTCSCSFSLFGWVCLWHDCCPLAGGVTCSDLKHCCPSGTTCDGGQGICVSSDGQSSTPWTDKTKATVAGTAAAKAQEAKVQRQQQHAVEGRRHAEGEGDMLLAKGRGGSKDGAAQKIQLPA